MAALTRDTKNAMLGGVCAGLAKYLSTDATILRLAFVLAFVLFGVGPLLYLILWLVVPKDGE